MSATTEESKRKRTFLTDFALGGTAAAVSKTCAAPLERMKLLIQNQQELINQKVLTKQYAGFYDCVRSVVKNEGPLGLWRGNVANVLRYFPTQALNFAFKDKIKRIVNSKNSFAGNIAAGSCAGALSLGVVYPLDYARTRLAADAKVDSTGKIQRQFKGTIDVWQKTMKLDGPVGLYRGFAVSVLGIAIYRGLYFGLYDSLRPTVLGRDSVWHDSLLASFLLGWGVTISASCCSYPLDTVRRRMMLTSGGHAKYSSSFGCLQNIIVNEGSLQLFRGCGANILRSVAAAGALALYDKFQRWVFPLALE